MKNVITTSYSTILLIFTATFSCYAQDGNDILPPETTISVEQARANRDRFLANSDLEYSAFTYDYQQLKKFVEFIELEISKGVDVQYITVYLSQYENGDKTAFIAPLKADGTPNYEVKVLNHGSVNPPRNNDSRGSEKIRY